MHTATRCPIRSKLHYAGRLAGDGANAEGLEAVLQDFFQIRRGSKPSSANGSPARRFASAAWARARATGTLGRTAIVGSRIWECQYKFRIIMGPWDTGLPADAPRRRFLRRLVDWVKNYLGEELAWDLQLILKKEEVPAANWGKAAASDGAPGPRPTPAPRRRQSHFGSSAELISGQG